MNFAEFQSLREKVLCENRGVIDCAETNLYAALSRMIPPPTPVPARTVHRCHLAAEWCQRFGFPPETAGRALISCGVRDALNRLFTHYAGRGGRLWLPADNYPVYGELARNAGLVPQEYETLCEPSWPAAPAASGPELLLVSNPLKPLGRWLTPADVAVLRTWQRASPERRIILDTVYTFDTALHATTLELFTGGQTIVLHSLTKGWLHPRLFGVALVPEQDVAVLAPVFRASPPPQENLARARELLDRHAGMPGLVGGELARAWQRFSGALPKGTVGEAQQGSAAPGYFLVASARWSDLLENSNVLGLPATAFGSRRDDLTILSSLTFCS